MARSSSPRSSATRAARSRRSMGSGRSSAPRSSGASRGSRSSAVRYWRTAPPIANTASARAAAAIDARNASVGRSAASQWCASSAAAPAGVAAARAGLADRTVAIRSWRSRRSAGRRLPSRTSVSNAWRGRRAWLVSSPTSTPAATAGRIASRTSGSGRSAIAATNRSSTGRPATATIPSTRWVASGSSPICCAMVSVRVRGSGPMPPPRSTAISSSTKKGLPSDRAWTRETRSPSGSPPTSASTCRATSARSNRWRSILVVRSSRSRAASQVATGWPGGRSSVRALSTTSSRSWSRLRTTKVSRSRVDRSTQCRSSTTRRVGASSARASRKPSHTPKRRAWSRPLRASAGGFGLGVLAPDPADPGQQPGEVLPTRAEPVTHASDRRSAQEPAQRLGDRRIRHRVLGEVEAAATQDMDIGLRRERIGDERVEQPGLADPRLAGDHDDPRRALGGVVERVAQRLGLSRTPDETAARPQSGHGGSLRAREGREVGVPRGLRFRPMAGPVGHDDPDRDGRRRRPIRKDGPTCERSISSSARSWPTTSDGTAPAAGPRVPAMTMRTCGRSVLAPSRAGCTPATARRPRLGPDGPEPESLPLVVN